MTKILYFLFMFLAVPYGAEAAGVFGDDSFQLAKSVKLGRSLDTLTTDGWVTRTSSGGDNTISSRGTERKFCGSDCTDCDMGTGKCLKCQPGFAPSGANCEICPAGKYSPEGKECKTCPKGAYCDTAGLDNYKPCPPGKYNDTTGNTSSTSCKLCPDGKYKDAAGVSSCKTCPYGSYSATDRTNCISHPLKYAYREKRDDAWDAGDYPIGNCDTVKPDMEGATCMFLDRTGRGQCKTDNQWSSAECIVPCPIPTNGTVCSECIYYGERYMKCTAATCKSGYGWWAVRHSGGPVCNECDVPTNAISCSACEYDATYGQKCTSAVCKTGYEWKAGSGGYTCQKK